VARNVTGLRLALTLGSYVLVAQQSARNDTASDTHTWVDSFSWVVVWWK